MESELSNVLNERTWATAVSKNGERAIVFRYIATFGPNNPMASQPDRIILVWRYDSESGMPSPELREQMDDLEDRLSPFIEKNEFSTLALVSTGENLREWIYYTQSEEEFFERLNTALADAPRFPIEIHASPDPSWSTYETFKSGLKS